MTTAKTPKKATAPTTTIRIVPPITFELLEQQYQLVRYTLPDSMLHSKDKYKFARLHNQLKEQINAPYRSYTYDDLDGSRRWAIYVLYPRNPDEATNLPEVQFDGFNLPVREIKFSDLKLHVLIKLLQVSYFRRTDNAATNRFVGQDKCFIYARRRTEDNSKYHICLEIEIKGDLQNETIFSVYGQARTFAKQDTVDLNYININIYYALSEVRDGLAVFRQVKRSQITPNLNLYVQRTFAGDRTPLDFHDKNAVEQSRGYLVDRFINGFAQYLTQYGFQIEHIRREFQKYEEGEAGSFDLPLELLGTIYVYDVRFNQNHALAQYVDRFRTLFPQLVFEVVQQIEAECAVPVLVIQDGEAKAFRAEMPLFGETDPHNWLYEKFPGVAKQFINVNGNEVVQEFSRADYLEYDLELPNEAQMRMVLHELFLKDIILHQREVTTRLPLTATELMFVHRENRGRGDQKQAFEVALYFEGNQLHFLNLRDYTQKEAFYQRVDNMGVDWDACYEQLLKHYRKTNDGDDLTHYDIILGPGLFIDIEDAHEALLYEYDEILRRITEYNRQQFALDELKLARHYDTLIDDSDLTEDMLEMRGYIQFPKPLNLPKSKKHRAAVELYFALQKYDAYLDSLKPQYDPTTFQALMADEAFVEQVTHILPFEERGLRDQYKKTGKFAGEREADVIPIYRGIWYIPEDGRYVVGDTNPINSVQARAHRVRKFTVYQGDLNSVLVPLLEAMSVKFVRLRQYTVYPYYFHLIDLYLDNVLAHPAG